jgi:hypothetical protein
LERGSANDQGRKLKLFLYLLVWEIGVAGTFFGKNIFGGGGKRIADIATNLDALPEVQAVSRPIGSSFSCSQGIRCPRLHLRRHRSGEQSHDVPRDALSLFFNVGAASSGYPGAKNA